MFACPSLFDPQKYVSRGNRAMNEGSEETQNTREFKRAKGSYFIKNKPSRILFLRRKI